MKKILLFTATSLLWLSYSFGTIPNVFFSSDPTLSPDGTEIVFCYENDLWKVNALGGVAYRLTAMDGKESLPRFSPDGQWIAFTGMQNGRNNIYILPASGGDIRQLTFHEADDMVDSWSWDSKWVIFSSNRYNFVSVYKVPVEGGTPIRIFEHYLNNPHHAIQHPKTNHYYFTDSWESHTFPHRKHYKGDHSPQILSYNSSTKDFKQHTAYTGKDMWPTIDGDGNIYFVSDEFNGEYNLYQLKDGAKNQLTQFSQSIKRPQVSANGSSVVFEKDYQLWIYNSKLGQSSKVNITLFSNQTLANESSFDVEDRITSFDVSSDNKKLAFVSRGELFVSDDKGKFVKRITTNAAERVFEVKWADDNSTLIYSQTTNGWPNWFSISATGATAEKQLTFDEKTNRLLTLNSKRTLGVYLCGRDEVRLLDLKTGKSRTLVNDEIWGFQNSTPRFSPDDKFIVFTAYRSFEQDIFVHEISTGKTFNLTNTGVTETQPAWSPDGKYIYFAANRYTPNYPRGNGLSSIYRLPLFRFTTDLKADAFNQLFQKDVKKDSTVTIKIDMSSMLERWEEVSVSGGEQWAPYILDRKGETILLFLSDHDKGEAALWKRVFKPFEAEKTERLSPFKVSYEYQLAIGKDNVYILANRSIYKADLATNKLEKVEIKHKYSKQLKSEFNQMFWETWSIIQENFYEKGFHGVDWKGKRDYYAGFLPHMRSRENLRIVLNDMLGELNASHMGFNSSGDEEKPFYSTYTSSLGVVFSSTNPYMVERVIRLSNIDISEPTILKGDIIVAVNGRRIDPEQNREQYFSFPNRQDELALTVQRNGKELAVAVPTHTPSQVSELLYNEWIANNRLHVAQASNGRIAYVHMKDMSDRSLNQFIIDMTSHAEQAEALVFDLRYNRGGNVHDDVLRFLAQRPYLSWQYREGKLSPQPHFAPSGKPMILVMNEHSLSDAEMTAAGFRQLGLGKLLGTETYRWIIFTSSKTLVDGSSVRVPAWGCYTLSGDNLELNGVAPDIYINTTFNDRLDSKDPQLDRAIEEMLKEL